MEEEAGADLLPARMVNEFVYCPRLFWLEYVEREFAASYDTVDGERVHRRVDQPRGTLPDDPSDMRAEATSVELSSARLGVVAKIDVVRADEQTVLPIDFKRGRVPGYGPYDPERVQVAIQALLLREHGYACERGRIYYAASKTHVDVEIDDDLVALTTASIEGAKRVVDKTTIPPPLVNSPKCARCSLHAICLPDETNALRGPESSMPIRPFVGARADFRGNLV